MTQPQSLYQQEDIRYLVLTWSQHLNNICVQPSVL